MPINTNLNTAPYFDDFDLENQYYRVLFKPGYAVQARELTQMQTMLQSQIEQFGDNIFKEGSIVKGCNFTQLDDLEYVRIQDLWTPALETAETAFDPTAYIPKRQEEVVQGVLTEIDYVYQITGSVSGLTANIITADRGVEVRAPDLNTFYISYLNQSGTNRVFQAGEELTINEYRFKVSTQEPLGQNPSVVGTVRTTNVTTTSGKSFGIQAAPGIIFQKGHFLFADDQVLVVSKYDNNPTNVAVGFRVEETYVDALSDNSLYDNANGSNNENAPGADRLKLIPTLVVQATSAAREDADFFTLVQYQNGNAVTVRDVSQYNVLGEELARRTYEESGNYILNDFKISTTDKTFPEGSSNTSVHAVVGQGVAYVKGFRVENSAERSFVIDQIQETETLTNQNISFNYGNSLPIQRAANGQWLTAFAPTLNYTPETLRDADGPTSNGGSEVGSGMLFNLTPTKAFFSSIEVLSGAGSNEIHELAPNMTANEAIAFEGNHDMSHNGYGAPQKGSFFQKSAQGALVFPTGQRSLFSAENLAIPVRVRENVTGITNNTFTINANPGEDYNVQNDDIVVVDSTNTHIRVASYSTGANGSTLTINLEPADGSAANATVYYNKREVGTTSDGALAYDKTVKTLFVQITYTDNVVDYTLGVPDAFELVAITNPAELVNGNPKDYTKSFRLNYNQKDTFYDHSYVEYIPGRDIVSNGTTLLVEFKCFQVELPQTGQYFFTVNSYPNDLDPYDIPVYRSASGINYNLRDCFDFRPHIDNDIGVSYSNTTSGNPGVPLLNLKSRLLSFTNKPIPLIPAHNATASATLTYYLQRIDSVVVDSYGVISLVKGKEEKNAAPPSLSPDQLEIGEVLIPGFPALSQRQASRTGRKAYAVHTRSKGVKVYTMKDMHAMSAQIDRMAYYISLNQLEQDTQNMFIPDQDGLDRFKNGFIVDPFNDLSVADVRDPEFKAAVPFNQKILTPAVKTIPLDLKYKSASGASIFPAVNKAKVATLGRDSNVDVISQDYATGFRNCVSNAYSYRGIGELSPPYDAAYDTTVTPAEINIDMTSAFQDFVENLQEFIPLTDVTTERVVEAENNWFGNADGLAPPNMFPFLGDGFMDRFRGGNTLTTRIETTTRSLELNTSNMQQNFQVGEFVRNFNFEPFMAGRDIGIYMTGLRPNARHYFFFDGEDVNAHIIPGTNVNSADDVQRAGQKGDAVSSDSNGVLRAVFALPSETFFVGDRVLEISDIDTYSQIESAGISRGHITYRAYNFSVEKSALGVTTRAPSFDINSSSSFRTVVRRIPAADPLAQTFFIKKGMGQGSNSVYISEVDLFFKRKSDTNGVTVELREVINGYPSGQVIPFGRVHKLATDVNVSDDASLATTFTFEAPVRLDVEAEYAVSIKPDAQDPNYLAYISQIGGTDLTPGPTQGAAVVQDWGDGVLFSSTNNSAWRSYQDEDLKFVLRRHNFATSSGTVTLTNNDHEFFIVDSWNGRFLPGEQIYQEKASTDTVGIPVGSATVTGTALDTKYFDGDFVLIEDSNGNKDIFEVVAVQSATQMLLNKENALPGAGDSCTPVVKGNLCWYDINDPTQMYLEDSSANSNRVFVAGTIYGLDSEKSATVTALQNINLSYFQPMIMKATDSTSTLDVDGTFVPPANLSSTYNMPLSFKDNNHFNFAGAVLYSRSNDPAGAQAFDLNIRMENGSNVTSTPFVDLEVSKLLAYQYKLNDGQQFNNPTSTYISKKIELAVDLDAEDIYVAASGYRPPNSNIRFFIKAQNGFDFTAFADLPWVELELFEGVDMFSSQANIHDYREFGYRIADANKDSQGVYTYQVDTGGVGTDPTFQSFRRFAIKIVLESDTVHNAPTLKDYRAIAVT